MGQPYVGQIIAVGFNFAPVNWLLCDGSLQQISQFDMLYTLLGTTYGGNGTTTFGLPDLRGRSPIGFGQGGGLSNYALGQIGGAERVTLTANQVGAHSHTLLASAQSGTSVTPGPGVVLGQNPRSEVNVYGAPPANTALAGRAIGASTAGGQPHENRQPSLAITYIICAFGIYPSQS